MSFSIIIMSINIWLAWHSIPGMVNLLLKDTIPGFWLMSKSRLLKDVDDNFIFRFIRQQEQNTLRLRKYFHNLRNISRRKKQYKFTARKNSIHLYSTWRVRATYVIIGKTSAPLRLEKIVLTYLIILTRGCCEASLSYFLYHQLFASKVPSKSVQQFQRLAGTNR